MIDLLQLFLQENWLTIFLKNRIFIAMLCSFGGCHYVTTTYAQVISCEIGNTSSYVFPQGYWQMVGPPRQGKCIIPGAPHPDSAFLHGNVNGAFRIEGRYRVDTVLTGWGFVCTSGECPSNSCISGFREWMCNDVYDGFYMENSMCISPGGCGGGKAYACFTDTHAVTLWEWKCNPAPQEPVQPTHNQGPPSCPL